MLPFFAYHRIWDEWYRNSKIQVPAFTNVVLDGSSSLSNKVTMSMPWYANTAEFNLTSLNSDILNLNDGTSLLSLRQRNWAKDYFTTAALYPQASGDVTGSTVTVDTSGSSTQISIPALRAANVLQRWLDRNNVSGERYADQIKGQYGIMPSDAVMDRPILLGSDVMGVYNRSVYTQSSNSSINTGNNPYNGLTGAKAGDCTGFKDGQLVENFKSSEHGYLIVLASLVPHAYYSTGTRRQLLHYQQGDFAIPLLQGLGEQAIYKIELSNDGPRRNTQISGGVELGDIFGYQQQYSEYKYHDDEVHGLLRDGYDLSAFCLQRSFDSSSDVELSTDFVEIPVEYMDQVAATTVSTSGFSAWVDCFVSMKKTSPLSEYVIPTLGDLKNTHKETIPYRGTML